MRDRAVQLVLPHRAALAYVIATSLMVLGLEPKVDAATWTALEQGAKACGDASHLNTCVRPLQQRETDAPVQDGLYIFEDDASLRVFGVPHETKIKQLPRINDAVGSLLGPAGLPTTGCLWLIVAKRQGGVTCGRFAFCACSLDEDCRRWRSSALERSTTYGHPVGSDILSKKKGVTWTQKELRFACHATGMRHIMLVSLRWSRTGAVWAAASQCFLAAVNSRDTQ